MTTPAQADMQRWSDEVARDPRSLSFLPLARAYRKQGLREAAVQLCTRGLEAHPAHVEAHGLLALLHLDDGDHQRAADEWSFVLRVDPDNFEALRGMGFCCLEQDRLSRARQMLERAALIRPGDETVQEALRLIGTRQEIIEKGLTTGDLPGGDPWAGSEHGPIFMLAPSAMVDAPDANGTPDATPPELEEATRPIGGSLHAGGPPPLDPALLFDDLLAGGPMLGALLIDTNGLVLAGRLTDAMRGDPAVLGAVLGGALGEATRTALHLGLGSWRGILMESENAQLHLAPAGPRAALVLAARRDAHAGWLVRTSAHAIEQAQRFMEEYA